ncbi:unnamed protein product [Schistosoma mattheei]|uniref:Uncharacterized protein n=1 Tax=Schistosoma mattheei TaxID=31246 RepID=A0AA85B4J4_9TREM|nr:unnamed protein product [Schistosoma mattheei]
MDFLTCASCMRNGICLPVTIVKCMVGNELIFCQNKEHVRTCVVSDNIKLLEVSEISLHTDHHESKGELEWTTEVFHAPLRSDTLSSTKSSGEVTITTDTVFNLHPFENVTPETKNMTSKFSNTIVTNGTCSLSTSHPGCRTTYSHYKRSILRQLKCTYSIDRINFANNNLRKSSSSKVRARFFSKPESRSILVIFSSIAETPVDSQAITSGVGDNPFVQQVSM